MMVGCFFAVESRYGDVQKQNTTYPPARKRDVLESCRFIDDFRGLRVIDGGQVGFLTSS